MATKKKSTKTIPQIRTYGTDAKKRLPHVRNDKQRKAKPILRRSASGKLYKERRENRSDRNVGKKGYRKGNYL